MSGKEANMSSTKARRPVYLNLFRIRFPVGAIASIGHRVAGVVLAVLLPFLVAVFERSLNSEAAFHRIAEILHGPLGIVTGLIVCWALIHHVLAGIRHLLMDVDIGSSLPVARKTALMVLIGGGLAVLLMLWSLLK
ncbi:MAG: succinate dehydrogenase, cytochrome b556 subunit [Candidatus Dechloromonas phosphoritropha]|jgi:succinate dehydrogenase / fumarate reductase cytochrome b subunit